jgi:hypothetical protein
VKAITRRVYVVEDHFGHGHGHGHGGGHGGGKPMDTAFDKIADLWAVAARWTPLELTAVQWKTGIRGNASTC